MPAARSHFLMSLMEGPSFFAGPRLDFLPAFFADFGSNGILSKS